MAMKKRRTHDRLFICLGEVISMRRKKLGLSQADLARESGVDRAFISNLESGSRNPSFGTMQSIADGLRIKLSRMLTKCEQCMDSHN